MQIQVNFGSVPSSAALEEHVEKELGHALAHMSDRLTRVEVHLGDTNSAAKHGSRDKRCMLEARPRGIDPIVVEHFGDDIYHVVTEAAGKLQRTLKKRFDKMGD